MPTPPHKKVGKHVPGNPAPPGANHWGDGFNKALKNALENTGWPKDSYPNVPVTFHVDIDVTNPGNVKEYKVTLAGP